MGRHGGVIVAAWFAGLGLLGVALASGAMGPAAVLLLVAGGLLVGGSAAWVVGWRMGERRRWRRALHGALDAEIARRRGGR